MRQTAGEGFDPVGHNPNCRCGGPDRSDKNGGGIDVLEILPAAYRIRS